MAPHAQPHHGSGTLAFRGAFVHTPTYGEVETLRDTVLVVQNGKIAKIAGGANEAAVLQEFGLAPTAVRRLKVRGPPRVPSLRGRGSRPALHSHATKGFVVWAGVTDERRLPCAACDPQDGEYFVPGFIDTHVHAPQVCMRPPRRKNPSHCCCLEGGGFFWSAFVLTIPPCFRPPVGPPPAAPPHSTSSRGRARTCR